MDASGLRIFESVARNGSMNRAAAELHTVQSNVTARIRLRMPTTATWPKSHPDWPGTAPSAYSSCSADYLFFISSMHGRRSDLTPIKDRFIMLMQKIRSSFLFGGNAPYVEEQSELYLADPVSVADEWRAYFDALRETPAIDGSDRDDEPHAPVVSTFVDLGKRSRAAEMTLDDGLAVARKQVAVQSLIDAFKYHKGFSSVTQTSDGPVDVELAFNPSHLEIVNPVVQGMARAKGEVLGAGDGSEVLPVEIVLR